MGHICGDRWKVTDQRVGAARPDGCREARVRWTIQRAAMQGEASAVGTLGVCVRACVCSQTQGWINRKRSAALNCADYTALIPASFASYLPQTEESDVRAAL